MQYKFFNRCLNFNLMTERRLILDSRSVDKLVAFMFQILIADFFKRTHWSLFYFAISFSDVQISDITISRSRTGTLFRAISYIICLSSLSYFIFVQIYLVLFRIHYHRRTDYNTESSIRLTR